MSDIERNLYNALKSDGEHIKKQDSELTRLRAELEEANKLVNKYAYERDRAKQERDDAERRCEDAKARAESLEAENRRLRAALPDPAKLETLARLFDKVDEMGEGVVCNEVQRDIRRWAENARQALQATTGAKVAVEWLEKLKAHHEIVSPNMPSGSRVMIDNALAAIAKELGGVE